VKFGRAGVRKGKVLKDLRKDRHEVKPKAKKRVCLGENEAIITKSGIAAKQGTRPEREGGQVEMGNYSKNMCHRESALTKVEWQARVKNWGRKTGVRRKKRSPIWGTVIGEGDKRGYNWNEKWVVLMKEAKRRIHETERLKRDGNQVGISEEVE